MRGLPTMRFGLAKREPTLGEALRLGRDTLDFVDGLNEEPPDRGRTCDGGRKDLLPLRRAGVDLRMDLDADRPIDFEPRRLLMLLRPIRLLDDDRLLGRIPLVLGRDTERWAERIPLRRALWLDRWAKSSSPQIRTKAKTKTASLEAQPKFLILIAVPPLYAVSSCGAVLAKQPEARQ